MDFEIVAILEALVVLVIRQSLLETLRAWG